jgi:UDP-glucose 4-epimerase
MKVLVTGSAGHLGEALMRTLPHLGHDPIGLDLKPSTFTHHVGSIADREFVRRSIRDVEAVIHSATLHKPHVATHSRQAFIDTNVTGTLNLLEEAGSAHVRAFVFTSTTSAFGRALIPPSSSAPAAWITEEVESVPKNIYGLTKLVAEQLCELFHRKFGLPCLVLRTSRFFPEPDDRKEIRHTYADPNAKANEFLYRRVDIEDVVEAHALALSKAREVGFRRYIISATTPFTRDDLGDLRTSAPVVVARLVPRYQQVYASRQWAIFPDIDRVYVNDLARRELGWRPRYDFARILDLLESTGVVSSPLAQIVGIKGYHAQTFADEPYPVES